MPKWKNYIKGVFDTKPDFQKIIVTGSARMEFLRQTGDSLAGRYFRHRLLPFSLAEISDIYPTTIEKFLERGGFPEPFLADNIADSDRWRMQYIDGLIRTDVLDFEKIHDFRAIQLVLELLRNRVGSPVSYNSIAEDVGIAPNTVKKYIQIFESLYIIFRITPYSKNIARSLIKEPKIYFFDTGMVKGDKGIKFENFIAVSLLKHVYAINDYEGKYAELKYFRTKDGEEVVFCIVIDNNPIKMIEVKFADKTLSKALIKFHEKYNIPGIQLVHHLRQEREEKGIQIYKAFDFLKNLKL